jgi:hypothetical protein
MAILFMIEILFNVIEGGSLLEIFEIDTLFLIFMIFEIFWKTTGGETNVLFILIHVFTRLILLLNIVF